MAETLGHRGTRAVQRMVEYAPSTGGLALWVRHHDLAADAPQAGPVATDGATIFYAASFEALPLAEQAGWVAHEVLHIALRHAPRFTELQQLIGAADPRLFNTCADAIVNSTLSHLGWLTLPAGAVRLDTLLRQGLGIEQTVERALLEWDVERLYRAMADRASTSTRAGDRQDDAQRRRHGERDESKRDERERALAPAEHADLLPAPEGQRLPEQEAQSAREWAERITRAHAGDGAHSMLRTLLADLPRVRTPWEQVLRRQLARSLAPQPELSWSRPSRSYLANQGRLGAHRRMPFEPGTGPTRVVPRLVVVVDVSGSIDDALLERFSCEIEAIVRRSGAGLTLVIGDERVQRVERFAPGRGELLGICFDGRGGTDFTPLLEEADQHAPDITVVLTDLDGPARHRPRCPVIWAVTEAHARAEPPFGRKLVLA